MVWDYGGVLVRCAGQWGDACSAYTVLIKMVVLVVVQDYRWCSQFVQVVVQDYRVVHYLCEIIQSLQ